MWPTGMRRAVAASMSTLSTPDRVVRDGPQLRRGRDQLGVDRIGEEGEEALGRARLLTERLRRRRVLTVPDLGFVRGTEPIECFAGELAGYEAASHAAIRSPIISPWSS